MFESQNLLRLNKAFFEENYTNFTPRHYSQQDAYLSFNNLIDKLQTIHGFNVISLNIRSLLSNFDQFKDFVNSVNKNKKKLHCIFLQEIWNIRNANECMVSLDDYDFFYVARSNHRGGGVAIYCLTDLNPCIVSDACIMHDGLFESIAISCNISNRTLVLANFYFAHSSIARSKSDYFESFIETLGDWLASFQKVSDNIILGFDSNIDILKITENSNSAIFFNELISVGLLPSFYNPTRSTYANQSLIDNIFFSENIVLKKSFQSSESFSDHNMLFCNFQINTSAEYEPIFTYKRDLSEKNIFALRKKILESDWSYLFNDSNLNSAVDTFEKIFFECLNNTCPIQSRKINRKKHQHEFDFFNDNLRQLQKMKLDAERKYKRTNTIFNKNKMLNARTVFKKECRIAKAQFHKNKYESLKNNPKALWKYINITSKLNVQHNSKKIKLAVNDTISDDDLTNANMFLKQFRDAPLKIKQELPTSIEDFTVFNNRISSSTFFYFDIFPDELVKSIEGLNNSSSNDVSYVSNILLKKIAIEISAPLSHVINLSFKSGTFPVRWKDIIAVPVYKKKGSCFDVDNYRPISLINCFAKILENVANNRITAFLNKQSFFANHQFGFRANRSIHHAVLSNLNFITEQRNVNCHVNQLLLDIKKAFDSLDRSILISKLYRAGIRGFMLNWIKDYLSDRIVRVKVGNEISSNTFIAKDGVLQGSALSSTLFLVYINDILTSLNDRRNVSDEILNEINTIKSKYLIVLYADDAAAIISHRDPFQLAIDTKILSGLIFRFYTSNHICIHPNKTVFLHFNPKTNVKIDTSINFEFGSSLYPEYVVTKYASKSHERYLGVFYDANLKMDNFFNVYIGKMSRGLFYLCKNREFLPKEIKLLIYYAHVHSHIEFISPYLQMASVSTRKRISTIQKKCIRNIMQIKYNGHTAKHFQNLGVMPIDIIHRFNIYRLLLNIKNSCLDRVFFDHWKLNSETGFRTSSRLLNTFTISKARLSTFIKLPLFHYPSVYNAIITQYGMSPVDQLKSLLIQDYVNNNSCTGVNCYSCQNASNDRPAILRKMAIKNNRTDRLIKSKAAAKTLRFEKTSEKFVDMNVIN